MDLGLREMGEWDWVTATSPHSLLAYRNAKISERKRRLFACACCRMAWDLLQDERSRNAVISAERYADDLATQTEIDEAADSANGVLLGEINPVFRHAACAAFHCAAAGSTSWWVDRTWIEAALAIEGREIVTASAEDPEEVRRVLESWQEACGELGEPVGWGCANPAADMADLLRCIVVNPFRFVCFDSSWQTTTAITLAQGIYTDRAFDRIPILADALQDAGCDHPDVLRHCRAPGPHACGCWVVDLVLGKA